MDWPLSREEKRACAMQLYEQDVRAADLLLRSKDSSLKELRAEVKVLRRASLGATTTRPGAGGVLPAAACSPASSSSCSSEDSPLSGTRSDTPVPAPLGVRNGGDDGVAGLPAQSPLSDVSTDAGESGASEAWSKDVAQSGGEQPPQRNDLATERLRAGLAKFFSRRHNSDSHMSAAQQQRQQEQVAGLARHHSAEGAPELWAAIAHKYALPPSTAVHWLASTMDPLVPYQWPKGAVPAAVKKTVASLRALLPSADVGSGGDDDKLLTDLRAVGLRNAIEEYKTKAAFHQSTEHLDVLRALAFRGCPDESLRPQLWRGLLFGAADGPTAEQRHQYHELRAKAMGADLLATRLRAEVEGDARMAWRGEEFMARPGVAEAVVTVALTFALHRSMHVRGSTEMAALLMFVLAGGSPNAIAESEVEVFWLLSRIVEEGGIPEGVSGQARQANRVHALLRAYDPALADFLAQQGLAAFPSTRIGMALFTRAGFSLGDCARVWDTLISDPQRFAFCDCIVVALLLTCRRELHHRKGDVGGLAEVMLLAPRRVHNGNLMQVAHAICAFERRCGPGSSVPYPPPAAPPGGHRRSQSVARGGPHEGERTALEGAAAKLSSLWGQLRSTGAGVMRACQTTVTGSDGAQQVQAGAKAAPVEPRVRRPLAPATQERQASTADPIRDIIIM